MTEYLLMLAKIVGVMLVVIPIILAAITVEIDYFYKAKHEAKVKYTQYIIELMGKFGEIISGKLEEKKKNEASK